MMALTKDLKEVQKSLKQLTGQVERMAKRAASLEKAKAPKKARVRSKAAKKAAPAKAKAISATDMVFNIVKRSGKEINTASLKKKTGLKDNSIRAILSKLKKQGKIKSAGKGTYLKA